MTSITNLSSFVGRRRRVRGRGGYIPESAVPRPAIPSTKDTSSPSHPAVMAFWYCLLDPILMPPQCRIRFPKSSRHSFLAAGLASRSLFAGPPDRYTFQVCIFMCVDSGIPCSRHPLRPPVLLCCSRFSVPLGGLHTEAIRRSMSAMSPRHCAGKADRSAFRGMS